MLNLQEQTHQIREEQALQSLYSVASLSIKEGNIPIDSPLHEIGNIFGNNMVKLIKSLKEGSGISSFHLSRLLIPIISQIITTETMQELIDNLGKVLPMFKERDAIMINLQELHKACKIPEIRDLMYKMQKIFMGDCIASASDSIAIMKQRALLQYRLSSCDDTVQQLAVKEELQRVEKQLQLSYQASDTARDFCDKYDVGKFVMARKAQEAQSKIEMAKRILQGDPTDASAWYDLALSNAEYNGMNSDQLYDEAAKLGHAGACYKRTRDYIRDDPKQALVYIELGLADDSNHTNFDTPYYKQEKYRQYLEGLRPIVNDMLKPRPAPM